MKVRIVNKSSNPYPSYATEMSAGMDLRASLEEPDNTQTQQVAVQDTVQSTHKPTRIVCKNYSYGSTEVDLTYSHD